MLQPEKVSRSPTAQRDYDIRQQSRGMYDDEQEEDAFSKNDIDVDSDSNSSPPTLLGRYRGEFTPSYEGGGQKSARSVVAPSYAAFSIASIIGGVD